MNKKLFFITIISILFDQLIKFIISHFFSVYESITIINNFFNITYVKNTGAAFSILQGNQTLLIIITVLTILLINYFLTKDKNVNKFETITYGLLLGGIYGNLIDRILYGYVIDYLDFTIFGYNFAVFNLADILIVGTIFLLLINSFKKGGNNGKNSCKWWWD